MNLVQRNLDRLSQSQAIYNDQIAASLNNPPTSGFVRGFDPNTGKTIVQTLNGGIYKATPISTGGTAKGDLVFLQLSAGSTPIIDQMPR